jgi:hypothetical protein
VTSSQIKHTGYAIALAWPETYCKQAGAWYDFLLRKTGFNSCNHYRVGHAAVVLIAMDSGKCHYFDFGRYHAPLGYGRVRDENTDHDLAMHTRAEISSSNSIENIHDILHELYKNPSCHGVGPIHASITLINFKKAYSYAKKMQRNNPWEYGPFTWNGTNCSRFVRRVILSGSPPLKNLFRLALPFTISPSPMENVRSLGQRLVYGMMKISRESYRYDLTASYPKPMDLNQTLKEPQRPEDLPEKAQWLAGEGAGSWFHIKSSGDLFNVFRFNPDGDLECSGLFFSLGTQILDLKMAFEFIHISHCDQVLIRQKGNLFPLKRVKTEKNQKKDDAHSYLSF